MLNNILQGNNMNSKPLTINEHGQITIPRKFREILKSLTVVLEQDSEKSNVIKLVPVPDVGGSLSEYAKEDFIDFKNARDSAWENVVTDKFFNKAKGSQ